MATRLALCTRAWQKSQDDFWQPFGLAMKAQGRQPRLQRR